MSRVLVTDGEQRAALAIVRSLGRAGHDVFVCSRFPHALAGASRYCTAEAQIPDALRDPAAFLDEVQQLVTRWRIEVALPVTDAALLALLPARHQLSDVTLPFASDGAFRRLSNKALVLSAAEAVGLAVPAQHVVRCASEVDALLSSGALHFPLVIKPARSVSEAASGMQKWSVSHAADSAQLRARLHALPAAAYPVLLQRRIAGPGVGVFLLLWHDRVAAAFAHRRLREKPPSGGVSVYRESIAAPADLVDKATRLLQRFDWHGVAMVEFKVDEQTNTPYLMEVNGRFWGSLQLAIDAGVDFPLLLLQCAVGAAVPEPAPYEVGVRSRWWWGDIDHLLARLRRSRAELDLPHDAPGRLRVIQEFLASGRSRDRNEVLRRHDPWPFVRESIDWLRNRQ